MGEANFYYFTCLKKLVQVCKKVSKMDQKHLIRKIQKRAEFQKTVQADINENKKKKKKRKLDEEPGLAADASPDKKINADLNAAGTTVTKKKKKKKKKIQLGGETKAEVKPVNAEEERAENEDEEEEEKMEDDDDETPPEGAGTLVGTDSEGEDSIGKCEDPTTSTSTTTTAAEK